MIFLRVQRFHLVIARFGVFPRRVVFIFEEESAVTGVFRVDIQRAGSNRPAHHRRGAQLNFIDGADAVAFQHLQNQIPEQRPFGVNF